MERCQIYFFKKHIAKSVRYVIIYIPHVFFNSVFSVFFRDILFLMYFGLKFAFVKMQAFNKTL